jgi:hypothetical protein
MDSRSEENKGLVRRFGEAMNSRQFDALDDIVAPDSSLAVSEQLPSFGERPFDAAFGHAVGPRRRD